MPYLLPMPPRSKPIAGSRRQSKPRKSTLAKRAAEASCVPDFSLQDASTTRPAPKVSGLPNLKPSARKGVVLALPFEQIYTQKPNLPLNAPRLGIQQLLLDVPGLGQPVFSGVAAEGDTCSVTSSKNPDIHEARIGNEDDYWGAEELFVGPSPGLSPMSHVPSSRHHNRRIQQFAGWQEETIP
ncbi:hypothetical protein M422DRAFT_270231 [Sphaerobolus stellatus SS14]|uniref:Uncharacterized protein n=1 Tax=Sphaerobolus stellatus (strain SS14) TaxID=990650 RepID=A0A0C9UHQ0_SPHS4|nr:hypothetical protein M422DRAFT_270231 [Sphaerobolus stellatus SS14]